MSISPLHLALIGAGRMGQHHARVYSSTPGVKLAAVVDANPEQAAKVATQYGAQPLTLPPSELAAALKSLGITAAVVATPTIHHRAIAEPLLAAGLDLLIEKPLAPTPADAAALVALAAKHNCILAVGHSERFNPVYRALAPYRLTPKFIEINRISPMTFRSIDIGVVLDMMIHDLDIVHNLVHSAVTDVTAIGVCVLGKFEDIANARLTFANGCIANITASRLALKTERKMRLFSPTAYVSLDYQKKAGVVITKTANESQLEALRQRIRDGQLADLSQLNYTELVKYEELKITDVEPLRAQAEAFLHAVRTRTAPPVTGADGHAAVDLAARISQSITEHQWTDIAPL